MRKKVIASVAVVAALGIATGVAFAGGSSSTAAGSRLDDATPS